MYWCRNNNFKDQWESQLMDGMLHRSGQTREELEAAVQWAADMDEQLSCAHLADLDVRFLVAIIDCVDFVDPAPSYEYSGA